MKKLACVLICVLLSGAALAGTPQLIDYQGYLKDGSGNAVTGPIDFVFKIYTASSGGTQKWTETQNNVTVTGGLFSITLGSVTAIPDTVFNQSDRWLGIAVEGGSELSPRTRISSSAYGQRVATIDGASGGTVSGAITAGKGSFGTGNYNGGTDAFVAGQNNAASGTFAAVGGGELDTASGVWAVVGGGKLNNASGDGSVISGGRSNRARGAYSVVCGGGGVYPDSNFATATLSFVGGGKQNGIAGEGGCIVGGYGNRVTTSGLYNTIGGGESNTISGGTRSVIAGGQRDTVTADFGAIGGGAYNKVTGQFGIVPGGVGNVAGGNGSFAAGRYASASHPGAFVWADSNSGVFSSSANNQFSVRSTGGVRIYTNTALTAGVTMAAGASSWSSVSDSTKKRNIRLVDNSDILSRLMTLPIKQWSYKAQDASIEHIGPMAQDFYRIFKLGDDDKTISTIDPAGIALAAIQALNEKTEQLAVKTAEIDQLKQQLAELRASVEILAAQSAKPGSNKLAVVTPSGK